MRLVRLNNFSEIVRACYTEDKIFCLSNGGSTVLHTAIDSCVGAEVLKFAGSVQAYRVETDEGYLVGFALIDFNPIRVIVDSFIRPVMRPFTVQFNQAVTQFKNSGLEPI